MSYPRSSGGAGAGGGQRGGPAPAGGSTSSKRGPTPSSSGAGIPAQLRHSQVAPKSGHMASNMASGQPSKSVVAFRSLELCDRLKLEIENLASEISAHQVEREEYEKKFRQQLVEMDRIQHTLKQLQETHIVMKQQYEDEIVRLRHKLDAHPQGQGGEGDSRASGGSSLAGVSGGMNMGSTGPGQAHSSSPQGVKGLGSMPAGGQGAHHIGSPRKQGQSGSGPPSLGRGSMMGSPSSQMMPGGGAGPPISLPGMAGRRGRGLEDDYGRGPLGPNGQTVEPISKRPRLSDLASPGGPGGPPGPPLYLPHGVLHPPQGFGADEGGPPGDMGQGGLRGPLQRGPIPGISANLAGEGPRRISDDVQKGLGGSMLGMGGGVVGTRAEMGVPRETLMPGADNAGMVDIPDAISAELQYQVEYEGDASKGDGSGSRPDLTVELARSQDLRSVVCCVRFSTDGTKIAAGSHSCVKVFDVATFRQLYMCRKIPEQGHAEADPYVRAVCFSPDGQSVVAGMEKNSAKVLLTGEGGGRQSAITLSGHESEVYSLDWVSTMIASGSGDGRIRLWDSVTGACQASLGDNAGPQDGVTSVAVRQDTKMVAAASIDRIVHVWSTQTHKLLYRLDGHTESVYAVTFSHDGNRLVSGGLDKTIKVWDLAPGSESRLSPQAQTLPGGHKNYVLSVCFSQDGKYIISGSKDRSVTVWDASLMKKVATVTGFKNSVIGVSASPTSSAFATGSGDNLVCVWKYDQKLPRPSSRPVTPAGGAMSSSKAGGTMPEALATDEGTSRRNLETASGPADERKESSGRRGEGNSTKPTAGLGSRVGVGSGMDGRDVRGYDQQSITSGAHSRDRVPTSSAGGGPNAPPDLASDNSNSTRKEGAALESAGSRGSESLGKDDRRMSGDRDREKGLQEGNRRRGDTVPDVSDGKAAIEERSRVDNASSNAAKGIKSLADDSPERRSLPPKKDMQRRDSPPVTET